MGRSGRRLERLRALDPRVVDAALAALFLLIGAATVFGRDLNASDIRDGYREPGAIAVGTVLLVCAPIAVRRRWPLWALLVSATGVVTHLIAGWPEGILPIATLLLTYSAGAWCSTRDAVIGLASVAVTLIAVTIVDTPHLDAVGAFSTFAQFAAAWAVGLAMRSRRAVADAQVREAEERAEAERQSAARVLAEQRLLIAQELHDVVAHSMSVIAVQAGVGAHVLDERPAQARAALDAISTTSRGTLTELRRLLGVLRDADGVRSHEPAPGLRDLPRLVDEVRAAGVPVTLHVEGSADAVNGGVELSAYRVVQEALTNVIKHAGAPSRVAVSVRYGPGSLTIEVCDDGRGLAARASADDAPIPGSGHGLIGMRERIELWGGELSAGPAPGGGYRVRALLPYGDGG